LAGGAEEGLTATARRIEGSKERNTLKALCFLSFLLFKIPGSKVEQEHAEEAKRRD
jgi:hypothetical protein